MRVGGIRNHQYVEYLHHLGEGLLGSIADGLGRQLDDVVCELDVVTVLAVCLKVAPLHVSIHLDGINFLFFYFLLIDGMLHGLSEVDVKVLVGCGFLQLHQVEIEDGLVAVQTTQVAILEVLERVVLVRKEGRKVGQQIIDLQERILVVSIVLDEVPHLFELEVTIKQLSEGFRHEVLIYEW